MATIGVIVGSQRKPRAGLQITKFVINIIQDAFPKANLRLIDLGVWDFPIYNEPGVPSHTYSIDEYAHDKTKAWSREVTSHAGFIFVTPEYNWGYPASVKNAIDYLFHEWNGKPAMIVSYGGHGGSKSAQQLRQVLQAVRMQPVEPFVPLAFLNMDFAYRLTGGEDVGLGGPEGKDKWKDEQPEILEAFKRLNELVTKD